MSINKEYGMSTKMIAERKGIPDENKWVLTPLFESDQAWEKLFSEPVFPSARFLDKGG